MYLRVNCNARIFLLTAFCRYLAFFENLKSVKKWTWCFHAGVRKGNWRSTLHSEDFFDVLTPVVPVTSAIDVQIVYSIWWGLSIELDLRTILLPMSIVHSSEVLKKRPKSLPFIVIFHDVRLIAKPWFMVLCLNNEFGYLVQCLKSFW